MVTIAIMWASAVVACVVVVSARVQLVIAAYQAGLVSPGGPQTPLRK